MSKKIFSTLSTLLFILGVILIFFTNFSTIGLILLTISIAITCIQLADLINNEKFKNAILVVAIIVTITIIIFILTK